MSYKYFNPNKLHKDVGDCVIRAYAAATGVDWDTAFIKLTLRAYVMHDMPSSNGRYNEGRSRDGYSNRDSYANYSREMSDKLRRMMNETSSDRERDVIMRCISKLEN